MPVARVMSGMTRVFWIERWWPQVEAPTPGERQIRPDLRGDLSLTPPLQGAIVPLIELPCLVDWHPYEVHGLEDEPQCLDRPFQHGGVADVEVKSVCLQNQASLLSLNPACSDKSTSDQPVKRFSRFQTLSPCLSRTRRAAKVTFLSGVPARATVARLGADPHRLLQVSLAEGSAGRRAGAASATLAEVGA
jgi:hypothetical protein